MRWPAAHKVAGRHGLSTCTPMLYYSQLFHPTTGRTEQRCTVRKVANFSPRSVVTCVSPLSVGRIEFGDSKRKITKE